MKNKIIYNHSNEKGGWSAVCVQNKYGRFWGHSFCAPEDMKNFSAHAGERYAEIRAGIKFAKFRMKQEKIKYKTMHNFINDFYCNPDYNKEHDPEYKNNPIYKHAIVKEKEYKKNIEYWEKIIELLKNSIQIQDKQRQDILLRSNKNN